MSNNKVCTECEAELTSDNQVCIYCGGCNGCSGCCDCDDTVECTMCSNPKHSCVCGEDE